MAVDAAGNVYVADSGNNKIRKITPGTPGSGVGGTVSSYTGAAGIWMSFGATDGPAAGATFIQPSGLAVDPSGNIYVADTGNNKIRMITPWGEVSTSGGTGAIGANDGAALGSASRGPGSRSGRQRQRLCGGPVQQPDPDDRVLRSGDDPGGRWQLWFLP